MSAALHVRWLGRVRYRDAHALQRSLHRTSDENYLLLLEHPHVYTLGVRAKASHLMVDPPDVGAELAEADRGGDVTYHGPGQLVAYPILNVPMGSAAVPTFVHGVEQVVIDTLHRLGLSSAGRLPGYPGVWMGYDGPSPRKICAVGVRVTKRRSMHGLALNVAPDMTMFEHIVPCGIPDKAVTSVMAEGLDVGMAEVADALVHSAANQWSPHVPIDRQDVASDRGARVRNPGRVDIRLSSQWGSSLERRLAKAGVDPSSGEPLSARKPEWLRAKATMGPEYTSLKRTLSSLRLVTVCEEAGCPNIFECWAEGTATFMINGERCTRACGFCLVDTRRPGPPDREEPERVAEAVRRIGLAHVVVTAVARDDLDDGGATSFAATIEAVRRQSPRASVEVLVPDCKGDPDALGAIFDARPDVLNHNLETVARLQRAVRPSASYSRSLAVLGRASEAGLLTKSGLILGMGEEEDEVIASLGDLRAVGVDIVTLGQYLRPSAKHLPVVRWWGPEDFERIKWAAEEMGFAHVQASPLTRSSYHAKQAATSAEAGLSSVPAS